LNSQHRPGHLGPPPYATLKDFTPVCNLVSFPLILSVYAAHPAKNLPELVALRPAGCG
jgi:tripartite-type tricarboxylate transporter receptor subunit TctC